MFVLIMRTHEITTSQSVSRPVSLGGTVLNNLGRVPVDPGGLDVEFNYCTSGDTPLSNPDLND